MATNQKLWGGRFEGGLDPDAKRFSYSLHIDKRLAQYDIAVNQVHAKALAQKGIFSEDEAVAVCECLDELSTLFSDQESILLGDDEDIHSCIERHVTEKLGDLGKKLHTGKSRNDQVITDTRLFIKDACQDVIQLLSSLRYVLWCLASEHVDTIFPGMTHFQPAQPVLFAHHLLAYYEKFTRDQDRFEYCFSTTDVCSLGAGALAGNNYGLDREFVAEQLGFSRVTTNSMDTVSDRDFLLEFLSFSSICMTHLSRFCEELIVWNSPLVGFINIGDAFTTGSSIMPQKKNPDIAELIRGKSGRVIGNLMSLHHILKGLPLTYNRDLQEDKELMFDSVDTLQQSIHCFTKMIKTMTLNQDVIYTAMSKGYLLATDFADYLVRKGVPFRESHEITGKTVNYAIQIKKQLEELTLAEFHQFSSYVEEDVYHALTFEAAIQAKYVLGGTAKTEVEKQLKQIGENQQWKIH